MTVPLELVSSLLESKDKLHLLMQIKRREQIIRDWAGRLELADILVSEIEQLEAHLATLDEP